jgi:hypothetical protein
VATVALNPSYQEYLDPAGNELDGVRHRFETLGSLRAADRQSLTDEQRYDLGQAAHLDLVQEATNPTWSGLPRAERQALRTTDEPFLRWQLATFPLDLVVCNGRTAFEAVRQMTAARLVVSGTMALVTWFVALAEMPERTMGVVGWNRSLQHPTGLGKQGHFALGRVLDYHLDQPRDAGCYLGRG